jgi:hypothetical protein
MEDRLARMEARLQDSRMEEVGGDGQSPLLVNSENLMWQGNASSYTALEDEYERRYLTADNARNPELRRRLSSSPAPGSQDSESRVFSSMGAQGARPARERRLSNSISISDSIVNGEDDSQDDLHENNRGNQEPWSLTAVFSQEGLKWVCGITRTRDPVNIAERFARSSNRHLLSDQYLSLSPKSLETDEITAWEYVNGECFKIQLEP